MARVMKSSLGDSASYENYFQERYGGGIKDERMLQVGENLGDLEEIPYDLMLKNIRTCATFRLYNTSFIGQYYKRSPLRPGVDLCLQNPKVSKLHASIDICDWDDERPWGNTCPHKVTVYDEGSFNGTDVNGERAPSRAEGGVVIKLGDMIRLGSDELWKLEKLPIPTRYVPPAGRDTDGWKVKEVRPADVGSDACCFRNVSSWHDLSAILVDRAIIGVQEVEVCDTGDQPLPGLRFRINPNTKNGFTIAHKKAEEIGQRVKIGYKIRWLGSSHNKLVDGVASQWTDIQEMDTRAVFSMPQ